MTDGYMKDCCKVMKNAKNQLEQLKRGMAGLDLFVNVWENRLDAVASDDMKKALYSVQTTAHIYLNGFRAMVDETVEIPKKRSSQPGRTSQSLLQMQPGRKPALQTGTDDKFGSMPDVKTRE